MKNALEKLIDEECLDRMIPVAEPSLRRAVSELVTHPRFERHHQVSPTSALREQQPATCLVT